MSQYPYWKGTVYGAIAYLGSLAVTWLYVSWGQSAQLVVEPSREQLAAWYFYSANYVSLVEGISGYGSSGLTTGGADMIAQAGDPHFQVLYLFPILFCSGAGILLNISYRGNWGGPGLRGVWIAVGYGISMVVGAFVFSMRESGLGLTVRLGPSYAEAAIFGLILAGIAGGVGGLVYKLSRGTR